MKDDSTQPANSGSLHPACCACCREDIKAILKWIDALTDELHDAGETRKQTKRILWNLRAELDNNIKSRSTHNSLLDEPKSPSDPLDPIHKEKGSHSVKYCGRWVFERPNNQSEMTYLVRTPEGRTFLDHGTGQANVRGQIVAWLEMFPEPPISL